MGGHPRCARIEAVRGTEATTPQTRLVRIRPRPIIVIAASPTSFSANALTTATMLLAVLLMLAMAWVPPGACWTSQYLYTVAPTVPSNMDTSFPNWQAAQVTTLADDIGANVIQLPFTFQFYSPFRRLWIQPNGALSFVGPNPPCCTADLSACYFVDPATGCTFNSSAFTNLIMPCMTDLDPSFRQAAQIYYRTTHNRFDVRYDDIALYHQGSQTTFGYSFAVSLYATGQIEFRYYSVTDPTPTSPQDGTYFNNLQEDPNDPKSYREWLVGLRGGVMSPQDLAIQQLLQQGDDPASDTLSPQSFEQVQYAEEMLQWETDQPGVFPQRLAVQNNRTIAFCSMATDFCLYPTTGSPLVQTTLYLTSHGMSCAADSGHSFSCHFQAWTSSPLETYDVRTVTGRNGGTVNPQRQPAPLLSPATYDRRLHSLVCAMPTLAMLMAAGHPNQTAYLVTLVDTTASNLNPIIVMEEELVFEFSDELEEMSAYEAMIPPRQLLQQRICETCANHTTTCRQDCAGVYSGNATINPCGRCVGGTTSLALDTDLSCAGICFDPIHTGERTQTQCFCEQIYQFKITSESWISKAFAHSFTSQAMTHDTIEMYTTTTLPSGAVPVTTSPPITVDQYEDDGTLTPVNPPPVSTEVIFSASSLPSVKASSWNLFSAETLAAPVPSLCQFETRNKIMGTLTPMLYYQISLLVFALIISMCIVALREWDKHALAQTSLLPLSQSTGPTVPVIHLPLRRPTPRARRPPRAPRLPAPAPAAAAVPSTPSGGTAHPASPTPIQEAAAAMASPAPSTSASPDTAPVSPTVPLVQQPSSEDRRRLKAERLARRERRALLRQNMIGGDESPKPVPFTSLDFPPGIAEIEAIAEEHRAANVIFHQMRPRMLNISHSPSLADSGASASESVSTSRARHRPPPPPSLSVSSCAYLPSSRSVVLPHISPVMPGSGSSSSSFASFFESPTNVPPPPATPLDTSALALIPVPSPPISANYWPTYDTSQDFGFTYVRGGDGSGSNTTAMSPITVTLDPFMGTSTSGESQPFKFDFNGGFDIGQASSKKKHAGPSASGGGGYMPLASRLPFSFSPPPPPPPTFADAARTPH